MREFFRTPGNRAWMALLAVAILSPISSANATQEMESVIYQAPAQIAIAYGQQLIAPALPAGGTSVSQVQDVISSAPQQLASTYVQQFIPAESNLQLVKPPTPDQIASLYNHAQAAYEVSDDGVLPWQLVVDAQKNASLNASAKKLAKAGRWAALRRKTVGLCLGGVQDAMDAIGIKLPRMRSAADMAKPLAKDRRFLELSVPKDELASLPPGIIVVWARSEGHPHGHISITQGQGKESSDHIGTLKPDITPKYRVFIPKS